MASLRVGERDLLDEPPRLGGVVVRDGRLEVLPERRRLLKLPPEPPQQAHGCLVGHMRDDRARLSIGATAAAKRPRQKTLMRRRDRGREAVAL